MRAISSGGYCVVPQSPLVAVAMTHWQPASRLSRIIVPAQVISASSG
jgi:hypothetical protein